jgi:hypothetical protein
VCVCMCVCVRACVCVLRVHSHICVYEACTVPYPTLTHTHKHMFRLGQNHIYTRCIYGNSGREITKHTVTYGVYIRFWPTLHMSN